MYSLQCRLMILENKGEVDAPIVSKIEKDCNCSLVFILLWEGKVVAFIVPLCRQLIVLPSLEKKQLKLLKYFPCKSMKLCRHLVTLLSLDSLFSFVVYSPHLTWKEIK